MAFLTNLRNLQHYIIALENRSHRIRFEIKALYQKILSKCAVCHISTSLSELLYFIIR